MTLKIKTIHKYNVFLQLLNKLNNEENIKRNLENEFKSVKNELIQYRTDIKNLTISKENEIERLKQFTCECSIVEEKQVPFIQGTILPRRNENRQRLPTPSFSRKQMPSKR